MFRTVTLGLCLAAACCATSLTPITITSGWATFSSTADWSPGSFGALPAGFFGTMNGVPSDQPTTGFVKLEGIPGAPTPAGSASNFQSTGFEWHNEPLVPIFQRLASADPTSADTVLVFPQAVTITDAADLPFEIAAMQLRGTLIVTYGGANPTPWDVTATLAGSSGGTLSLRHVTEDGGVLFPRVTLDLGFTFTHDGDTRTAAGIQTLPDGGGAWTVTSLTPIPEPSTVLLILGGIGLLGCVGLVSRRRI